MNAIQLSKLTREVMAQRSWSELKKSLDGGYCPTLRGETPAERTLIRVLRSKGYPVWGNKGRNW